MWAEKSPFLKANKSAMIKTQEYCQPKPTRVQLNMADHYGYPTWEQAILQSIQSFTAVLVIGSS